MGRLFTDTVYHDRTSLTGGEPYTAPVAQFVDGWRQTLQNMDAVHHQITNHVVNVDGDQATCTANMQGTHVLANASGGPMWTVGGRHEYQLTRTADGWRIKKRTFYRVSQVAPPPQTAAFARTLPLPRQWASSSPACPS